MKETVIIKYLLLFFVLLLSYLTLIEALETKSQFLKTIYYIISLAFLYRGYKILMLKIK